MRRNPKYDLKSGYGLRMQAALIAVLLFAVGMVNLWPEPAPADHSDIVFRSRGQETIAIEEIVQTRQRKEKPPPPPPLVPIVVSDAEIIDDLELDIQDDFLALSEDDESGDDLPEGDHTSAAPALMEPRPVRIVEPEYTRDAKRRNIRAEVVVEVLVDERGRVAAAEVVDRFLLGKDEAREEVVRIGYGLEESAIDAAQRCMFRPARFDGEAVRATARLVFSFGV
ncbi:MAG: energy transducer TonB [Rhodothermales bacterium]|nr:energy transducer TonB [Rhodothermales bacterium]